jgi:hypothetical protein
MEVSGQPHTPATLLPGKSLWYSLTRRLTGEETNILHPLGFKAQNNSQPSYYNDNTTLVSLHNAKAIISIPVLLLGNWFMQQAIYTLYDSKQ